MGVVLFVGLLLWFSQGGWGYARSRACVVSSRAFILCILDFFYFDFFFGTCRYSGNKVKLENDEKRRGKSMVVGEFPIPKAGS